MTKLQANQSAAAPDAGDECRLRFAASASLSFPLGGMTRFDSDNETKDDTSMKTIITLLRILFGVLVGFAGCIALLNAPYQLLNANFRFSNGGPFILVSLIVGGLMVWGAWRLIRGPRAHSPAA